MPPCRPTSARSNMKAITVLNWCQSLLIMVSLSSNWPLDTFSDLCSCSIRAEYANMPTPYINTNSMVSCYCDRKTNWTIMLAGTGCYVDATSRSNARPMHEEGVVCNLHSMVQNIFPHLYSDGTPPSIISISPIRVVAMPAQKTLWNP
ncbi:hypothetical protein O181_057516 [Austropuccinia psidii MF-1]|uniref:Uncharacterized protein n=1 Tax=Austropuccinia psidii MF-1 TaxID=1389203 RepID=A0A9Q3E8G9_9BASI|nr:hypothetical protein [Austropuccinia psidii MF-1]